MNKNKITVIIPTLGYGGAEKNIINLSEEWLKYGYSITIICMNNKGELITELNKKIELIDLKIKKISSFIVPLINYFTKNEAHIILVNIWPLNSYALIAGAIAKFKGCIYITEHNNIEKSYIKNNLFKKIYYRILIKLSYKYSTGIICVSKGLAEEIIKIMPNIIDKIKIIYNPIKILNEKREKINISSEKIWGVGDVFKILSVGELKKQKNHELLINAINIMKKEINLKLIVVGGGVLLDELKGKVKKLNLEDNIEFVGYQKDVEKWYSTADLFVLTSNWEGFGNVIVEALGYGLPIVSTNCPYGPSEILDGGVYGDLIECNNINSLINAIREKIKIKKPIIENIKRAEEFNCIKIARQYKDYFDLTSK